MTVTFSPVMRTSKRFIAEPMIARLAHVKAVIGDRTVNGDTDACPPGEIRGVSPMTR